MVSECPAVVICEVMLGACLARFLFDVAVDIQSDFMCNVVHCYAELKVARMVHREDELTMIAPFSSFIAKLCCLLVDFLARSRANLCLAAESVDILSAVSTLHLHVNDVTMPLTWHQRRD
jgi:hypothetical protein